MRMPTRNVRELLNDVLAEGKHEIPPDQGFEGTGAPGLYLEHLLGLRTSNVDVPDAGAWEVKYTSGRALTTLFHKDPYPRGKAIRYIINRWGWIGKNKLQSFRHTICGESADFHVVDDANSIWVRRTRDDDISPYWPHDELVTAFARKLGNLILVKGSYSRKRRVVRYDSAELLSGAKTTQLIRSIANGLICIDFDAYIRANGSIRNHGTKFRIRPDDIRRLYARRQPVR